MYPKMPWGIAGYIYLRGPLRASLCVRRWRWPRVAAARDQRMDGRDGRRLRSDLAAAPAVCRQLPLNIPHVTIAAASQPLKPGAP